MQDVENFLKMIKDFGRLRVKTVNPIWGRCYKAHHNCRNHIPLIVMSIVNDVSIRFVDQTILFDSDIIFLTKVGL